MNRSRTRNVLIIAGMLLLAAWAWSWYRAEARVRRVRELREELLSEDGRNLTSEQRREKVLELVTAYKSVPLRDRRQFAEQNEQLKVYWDRLRRFAKASPKEQLAMLDEDIKRQEQMRAQLEKKLRQASVAGGGGDSGNTGAGGGDTNSRNGGQSATRGGAQRLAFPRSREDVDRTRKELLDMSSPEDRANRALYMNKLVQRRTALGLSPHPWGR